MRRLLVCDANGKLAGLLSSDDLLGALMEPLHALAGAFRTGIQREEARRDPARLAPPPALFIAAQDHTELA